VPTNQPCPRLPALPAARKASRTPMPCCQQRPLANDAQQLRPRRPAGLAGAAGPAGPGSPPAPPSPGPIPEESLSSQLKPNSHRLLAILADPKGGPPNPEVDAVARRVPGPGPPAGPQKRSSKARRACPARAPGLALNSGETPCLPADQPAPGLRPGRGFPQAPDTSGPRSSRVFAASSEKRSASYCQTSPHSAVLSQ